MEIKQFVKHFKQSEEKNRQRGRKAEVLYSVAATELKKSCLYE